VKVEQPKSEDQIGYEPGSAVAGCTRADGKVRTLRTYWHRVLPLNRYFGRVQDYLPGQPTLWCRGARYDLARCTKGRRASCKSDWL